MITEMTVQFPYHLAQHLDQARRETSDLTYNAVIQAALEAAKANPDLPMPAPTTKRRLTVRFDSGLIPDVDSSLPERVRWALWAHMFEKSIKEIKSILAKYVDEETNQTQALEQIIQIITNLAGHISSEDKAMT